MYPKNYKSGDEDDGGDRNPYRSERKEPDFLPLPAGFVMSEARRRADVPRLRTFKEWSNDGFAIIKGSKHVGRNEAGQCLFSEEQVKYSPGWSDCGEQDDDWDEFDPDLPGNPHDYGHSD